MYIGFDGINLKLMSSPNASPCFRLFSTEMSSFSPNAICCLSKFYKAFKSKLKTKLPPLVISRIENQSPILLFPHYK